MIDAIRKLGKFAEWAIYLALCVSPIAKYGLDHSLAYVICLPLFLIALHYSERFRNHFRRAFAALGYTRETGDSILNATLFSGLVTTIGLGWSRSPSDLMPYIYTVLGIAIFSIFLLEK